MYPLIEYFAVLPRHSVEPLRAGGAHLPRPGSRASPAWPTRPWIAQRPPAPNKIRMERRNVRTQSVLAARLLAWRFTRLWWHWRHLLARCTARKGRTAPHAAAGCHVQCSSAHANYRSVYPRPYSAHAELLRARGAPGHAWVHAAQVENSAAQLARPINQLCTSGRIVLRRARARA